MLPVCLDAQEATTVRHSAISVTIDALSSDRPTCNFARHLRAVRGRSSGLRDLEFGLLPCIFASARRAGAAPTVFCEAADCKIVNIIGTILASQRLDCPRVTNLAGQLSYGSAGSWELGHL